MNDFINTKIIATVGPSCSTAEIIEQLFDAGARAFRLNFSHGSFDFYKNIVDIIRQIELKRCIDIPIIQDLQGPKIRLNAFTKLLEIKDGDDFTLFVCDNIEDKKDNICIVYPNLLDELKVNQTIKIDDGNIELKVTKISCDCIITKVIAGGVIKPRKGVNFPETKLSLPSLTKKDICDLKFGIELGVDYVALSFVRCAEDIIKLKQILEYEGSTAEIISKIEKPEALIDIDRIIDNSDVILIARGDLGVELNLERVPGVQKDIIDLCRIRKTPVIVATQMLESMTENYNPTRAEVTDVYLAVSEGADIVMLSGETASGKYPVQAVKMMKKIISEAELNLYQDVSSLNLTENIDETIAIMSTILTNKIKASFICVFTTSGWTAKLLSKTNLKHPIIAFTPHKEIKRKISLYQGVIPMDVEKIYDLDKLFEIVNEMLKEKKLVNIGENVVVVTGQPFNKSGNTNILKVHTIT
jgi:pyruvate kinase